MQRIYLRFWLMAFMLVMLVGCGVENTPAQPTIFSLAPAPVLGIVLDGQGIVVTVEPHSGAAKADLRVGDQVLTVHDQAFKNVSNQQVRTSIDRSQPITFTIQRGGQEITLIVTASYPQGNGRPDQATGTPVPNNYRYW